jgi:MFS transporter, PPP family, 3-phenylpropionic acid transporter
MIARRFHLTGTNPLLVGSLFYWFYWAFVAAYDPFLNVYFSNLGLSGLQIGMIASVVPIASLIWAPFISAIADKHNKRVKFLQWSMTAWMVMLGIVSLPKTFWVILPLVFLMSLARSSTTPLADSMIVGMAVRHGLSFGRMRMWGSAGFALVSIVCGYLWAQVGYSPMFGIAIMLALPVIYLSVKLESGPVVSSQTRGSIMELLRDPGLVTLFVLSFLMGAALLSTYVFGAIYMASMGGNESMMGLMFGLSALVEVPVMHYSGNVIDRLTSVRTLWLSLFILTLSIFGFVFSSTPAMLVMTNMVKGAGFGLFAVTLVRLIDERSPDEWKSTAQAISSVCLFGLSMLLTSALFGYLYDNFGGVALYMVATMMGITAVILMGFAVAKNWFIPLR